MTVSDELNDPNYSKVLSYSLIWPTPNLAARPVVSGFVSHHNTKYVYYWQ